MEQIEGLVERIKFHNPESGWTIIELLNNQDKKRIIITLTQVGVAPGMNLELSGKWIADDKYGPQFKVTSYKTSPPSSLDAIEKYLSAGLFSNIGAGWASKIVKAFSENTLDILDKEPERLVEIGFAKKHLDTFKKEWYDANIGRDVIVFLETLGLSFNQSQKAFNELGESAEALVKNDPYILFEEVSSIGFKTADNVALKLGLDIDHERRILSGIRYIYSQIQSEGHSYLTEEQLLNITKETLSLGSAADEKITALINALVEAKVLVKYQEALYLSSIFKVENTIVDKIHSLLETKVEQEDDVNRKIRSEAEQKNLTLSEEQLNAVITIINSPVSVLTGGAGVGKTTTVKFLLQVLQNMNKEILLAAPTGRAAQRMTEVINQPAQTLHRLLKWSVEEGRFMQDEDNTLKADFIVIDEVSMVDAFLMKALLESIGPRTQLLLIGDPNQLPSVGMGAILESFIESKVMPICALTQIFRQELESSIVKYSYEIMSGRLPKIPSPVVNPSLLDQKVDALFIDSELATESEKKFIVKFSNIIKKESKQSEKRNFSAKERSGHLDIQGIHKYLKPDLGPAEQNEVVEICKTIKPYSSLLEGMDAQDSVLIWYEKIIPAFYNIQNIQVLSPMKKYELGTKNLNQKLQHQLNPPSENKSELKFGDTIFRVGDKVIQLKNDYQKMIFNGDIGKIAVVDVEKKKTAVKFDSRADIVWLDREELETLDLAYAITIHKSQGSEFDAVIIPMSPQHLNMLNRNLIYTAMTRGKKLVIFIGSRTALAIGASRSEKSTRQTKLVNLLKRET